jgi:hypothetical protein
VSPLIIELTAIAFAAAVGGAALISVVSSLNDTFVMTVVQDVVQQITETRSASLDQR